MQPAAVIRIRIGILVISTATSIIVIADIVSVIFSDVITVIPFSIRLSLPLLLF